MEIIISIAAKVAKYTMKPIGIQVGYLSYYKDNFKELKDQMEELKRAKERIEHDIEAERRNGKEIESDVQNWLIRVDEIIEAANKLSEDPRHAIVWYRWHCLDLKSRRELSKNAKKITRNIVEEQGKGQFDRVGYLPPLIESRKSVKEDILLSLRGHNVRKVGIYGLAGVGKTTIAKEVARQAIDDELFDAVIMVHVSPNPNIERIQDEIADFLGLHFEEKGVAGRARCLCERIKKEENILIVLDDIWAVLDLEELGFPLEDNHNGCKFLLTSRSRVILQKLETQKEMRLEVLNEKETVYLFEDKAGDAIKDASLQKIATQVAYNCNGLPLLIVTVARALRNKDIDYWKDALSQLHRVENEELIVTVYSALKFSYNQLAGDELKAVFLLGGLLESNGEVRHMLKCVMGLGILKNINTVEDAWIRLFRLINSLKASCLLLEDSTNEQVKMHEVVRDVAISIAAKDQHVLKIERDREEEEWPSKDLLQRSRCIIMKWYNDTQHFGVLPDSFFEGMGNLRVLTLTCMNFSLLPTSFRFLVDLRTLCLHQCIVGDMTDIGASKNLQILSLCGSSFLERIMPSAIRQLTSLRMLDLSNSRTEVIPPNIISNLTKLEELYLGNNPLNWEVGSSNKQSLAEFRHLTNLTALEIQIQEGWILPMELMFEKLQRYKIVIGDEWIRTSKHGASRLLKLKLDASIHLEHGIKALIKRVEDLYLDEMKDISSVLYHLNEEGFPLLKHLHIQNNANVHYIIDSKGRNLSHVLFPKLETLALHNLNKLEKICHGPLMVNSFAKLKIIKVESCGQLEYLFSVPMVKELSQLFEIEVSKCSAMKNIVSMERMDSSITMQMIISLHSLTLRHLPAIENFCSRDCFESSTTSFFNVKVAFPNLETLELCSINLNQIWDDDKHFETHSLQNVANLTVKDCGGLKYLLSPFMIKSLKNLKRLEISKCHMMEEIIASQGRNNEVAPNDEVGVFKLEKLIVSDMKSLKTMWHIQFEGLKILKVKKCEKLENIFQSCNMQKALRSLETLEVNYCPLVEEIFELNANHGMHMEEDATHLKNLILVGLPKMKQIWSRDPHGTLRFFNLQVVEIRKCENLDYLFPFSIAKDLPQLEDLTVFSCGIKEVVAKKEGAMEGTVTFELNHLISLHFSNLHKLKVFFYPGLHTLECRSLRELWVDNCNGLITLITSSTARGLVKLKSMKIRECNSLEQVVAEEEGGTQEKKSV